MATLNFAKALVKIETSVTYKIRNFDIFAVQGNLKALSRVLLTVIQSDIH